MSREQAFAKVDLMTAELEMTASIYDGFSTAIVGKDQPRTVGLFREFDDAVQVMALIAQTRGQSKALAKSNEPHPRIADLIGANNRAHDRKVRLSAALIKVVEHFERVDAPEADRRAIHSACQTWAGVKAEDLLDGRSAADPYALQKAIANLRHSIADEIPFGLTYVNSDDLTVVMDAVELATPARAEALDEGAGEKVRVLRVLMADPVSVNPGSPAQAALAWAIAQVERSSLDEGAAGEPVEDLWQELCERDDRTSGEEYPNMCLITFDELSDFITRAHPSPPPAACKACGGKRYIEHEGGDGEGWPSKLEIETCAQCAPPPAADEDRVRIAVEEMADAVDFFDSVKASSQTEQIAVGRDHWNRLEAAARAVAALRSEGKPR